MALDAGFNWGLNGADGLAWAPYIEVNVLRNIYCHVTTEINFKIKSPSMPPNPPAQGMTLFGIRLVGYICIM